MFVLTRDVSFVLAREEDVQTCINQFYGDDSDAVNDMLSALESEIEEVGDTLDAGDEDDEKGIEEAAGSTPVIRFVNLVLYQAVNDRASDIHFEPFEKEFKIRYRVDGALYEMAPPPKRLALPIISRIKVMAGLNIAERRLPQDGRIQLTIGGRADRPACLDPADPVRRERRAARAGPQRRVAGAREPRHAGRRLRAVHAGHRQAQRHHHRDRPDRVGQDDDAVLRRCAGSTRSSASC